MTRRRKDPADAVRYRHTPGGFIPEIDRGAGKLLAPGSPAASMPPEDDGSPMPEVALLVDVQSGVIDHGDPGRVLRTRADLLSRCRAGDRRANESSLTVLRIPAEDTNAGMISALLRNPEAARQLARDDLRKQGHPPPEDVEHIPATTN